MIVDKVRVQSRASKTSFEGRRLLSIQVLKGEVLEVHLVKPPTNLRRRESARKVVKRNLPIQDLRSLETVRVPAAVE